MDYLDNLDNTFSRLIDDIGYIYIDKENRPRIVQKSGSIRLRNIYFDIKGGEFISYITIKNNKRVISKLQYYQSNSYLICFIPIEEGYKVRVYNKYGELVYKQYIKFFDKLGRLSKWYMKKRYPELVLDK